LNISEDKSLSIIPTSGVEGTIKELLEGVRGIKTGADKFQSELEQGLREINRDVVELREAIEGVQIGIGGV